MTRHKRVLLLGPTGVGKSAAMEHLREAASRDGHELIYLDFEKEHLARARTWRNWHGFLFSNAQEQAHLWQQGWASCHDAIRAIPPESTAVLAIHGVYATSDSGVRSVIDVNRLCEDFAPTLIVTLIDDVFDLWWRTEDRAQGEDLRGRPSLEQLLEARRAESLVGDLIACQGSLSRPARHVMLSVQHPSSVLLDLIWFDSQMVYLSFPISAPRELLDEGDSTFVNEVNSFHREVIQRFSMMDRPKRVFISPLAIDELPLCAAIESAIKVGKDEVDFDPISTRWPISDLWNGSPLLADEFPQQSPIPIEQARDVLGLIKTDVSWRDYRLVRQANALGVFCPKPPNREDRLARGVEAEILAAVQMSDIQIYIWQREDWDTQNVVKRYFGTAGTMGMNPVQTRTTIVPDRNDFVDRILRS